MLKIPPSVISVHHQKAKSNVYLDESCCKTACQMEPQVPATEIQMQRKRGSGKLYIDKIDLL